MHFLKSFYFKNLRYLIINKFIYKKQIKLPELKKIILNFSLKTIDVKKLFSGLLIFELIVNQKGFLTTTKNSSIIISTRKGTPNGCKLTLKKHNLFQLFAYFLIDILPKIEKQLWLKNQAIISLTINDIFAFFNLETHYYFFNQLPKLNFIIVTNSKNNKENLFFYKLFYFF